MRSSYILILLGVVLPAASQQIWDIVRLFYSRSHSSTYDPFAQWQTTWDRTKLFTSLAPASAINFVAPGAIGSADIVINDGQKFQNIAGFGGSLSESVGCN